MVECLHQSAVGFGIYASQFARKLYLLLESKNHQFSLNGRFSSIFLEEGQNLTLLNP